MAMSIDNTSASFLGELQPRGSESEPTHSCVLCDFPIQVYGRLAACSHFFCLECCKEMKTCPLCQAEVTKVTPAAYRQPLYACLAPGCYKGYLSKFSLTEHQRLRNHLSTAPPPSALRPIATLPILPPQFPNPGIGQHSAPISANIPPSSHTASYPAPMGSAASPSIVPTIISIFGNQGINIPPNISESDLVALLQRNGVNPSQILAGRPQPNIPNTPIQLPSTHIPNMVNNSGQNFQQWSQPPQRPPTNDPRFQNQSYRPF